jgi:hypothetical protein
MPDVRPPRTHIGMSDRSEDQFDRSVDRTHDLVARIGCGLFVGAFVAFVSLVQLWPVSPWVPILIGLCIVLAAALMRRTWWRYWLYLVSFWP